MKWFWILTVFYLVTQVKSGPTKGDVPLNPLPITRIETVEGGNTNICTTGVVNTDEFYTLSVFENWKKVIDYESKSIEDKCISFVVDIQDWSNMDNLTFIVQLDTDYQNVFALGSVKKFPVVPFNLKYSLVKDPRHPTEENYLLRIEGNDLGNLVLESQSPLFVSSQSVAYYNGITSADYKSKAWYKTGDGVNDIQVCDGEIINAHAVGEATVDVESATFEIKDPETSAAINLQVATQAAGKSYDIVITHITKNTICPEMTSKLSCGVTRVEQGSDSYGVRVIELDDKGTITAAKNLAINDRDLIPSLIGTDILEGIWQHTHEPQNDKNYQFHLSDEPVPGTTVYVDCTNLHETHCYGYIAGVTAGSYSMKVKPMFNDKPITIDENQITYTPTTHQELAILSRHMTRHANQLMADVNICFQHLTPQEGGAFSHYEMLIINEKGQWLKHRILEEEEVSEGRLCFAPFTINTKDFDLTEGTKVVISQRGVDGFTVLATGEAKLL